MHFFKNILYKPAEKLHMHMFNTFNEQQKNQDILFTTFLINVAQIFGGFGDVVVLDHVWGNYMYISYPIIFQEYDSISKFGLKTEEKSTSEHFLCWK